MVLHTLHSDKSSKGKSGRGALDQSRMRRSDGDNPGQSARIAALDIELYANRNPTGVLTTTILASVGSRPRWR